MDNQADQGMVRLRDHKHDTEMVKTFLDRQVEIKYNASRTVGKLIPM